MGIQVPVDGAGKIVETITLTDHRQVFILGGDNAVAERASVKNTVPAATDYGVTARVVQRREGQTLSTANLGISGVFTQGAQDGNEDGAVFVCALAESNVDSAAQGFVIQEYDGDDDDFTDASLIRVVAAATYSNPNAQYIYARIRSRKWRVVYTNGGTGQASFKLTVASSSVVQDHHLDYDSGAGTVELPVVGIALPGAGGPVAGGTVANPLTVDWAGTDPPIGAGAEAVALLVTVATDSTGLLPISAASLPLPTGAATLAAQLPDDHDVTANAGIGDFLSIFGHTINEAFKESAAIGGQLDDAGTTAATEDNVAPVRITAQRALHINLRNSAGTEIGDTTTELETNLNIGGVAAIADNGASTTGTLRVTVANDSTGKLEVVGDVASDVAAAGNPVLIGGRANENEPTRVDTDADAVYLWVDRVGRLVTAPHFPSNLAGATHGPNTLTKSTAAIEDLVATPGASLSIYVTQLSASNTSATKSRLDTSDGATIRNSMMLAADGGGFVKDFNPPWKLAADAALRVTLGTAVTDVRINVDFFVAA